MSNTASRQAAFSSNKPKVTSRTTNTPAASTFRKRRDESRQGLWDHPQFNNGNEAGSEPRSRKSTVATLAVYCSCTRALGGHLCGGFQVRLRHRDDRRGAEWEGDRTKHVFQARKLPELSAGLIGIKSGILCFLL